jgi:hypothetical protein
MYRTVSNTTIAYLHHTLLYLFDILHSSVENRTFYRVLSNKSNDEHLKIMQIDIDDLANSFHRKLSKLNKFYLF